MVFMSKKSGMAKNYYKVNFSVICTFYHQTSTFFYFKYDIRDQHEKLRLVHILLAQFEKKNFLELLGGITGVKKVIISR